MKTDLYTKIILTIIAICLLMIVFKLSHTDTQKAYTQERFDPEIFGKGLNTSNDITLYGSIYSDVLHALNNSEIRIEQPIDVRGSVRQIYPIEVKVVN